MKLRSTLIPCFKKRHCESVRSSFGLPMRFFLLIGVFFMILVTGTAHAEIYSWIDKDGNVYYADDPSKVPAQYKAKNIRSSEASSSTVNQFGNVPNAQNEQQKEVQSSSDSKAGSSDANKKRDDSERDYYCNRARQYERDIANAKDELEAAKKSTVSSKVYVSPQYVGRNIIEGHYENQSSPDLQAVLNARAKIKTLEKSQADFEESARKQNIPPGWLRCEQS